MRSNLLLINQSFMCMSKPHPGSRTSPLNSTAIKIEELSSSPNAFTSSETSRASCDENDIIEFGPIKVKPRRKPAPTLATGRRSKYEILSPEEERKRTVRRARNRAAAERVRLSRLSIEQQLLNQINALEQQSQELSIDVQLLEHRKLNLETRLLTHEQMCANIDVNNSISCATITTPIDLLSLFPVENNVPTSSSLPTQQQYDITSKTLLTYDRTSSWFNFDEIFPDSSSSEQQQYAFPSTTFPTIMPSDDLDEFFMNS